MKGIQHFINNLCGVAINMNCKVEITHEEVFDHILQRTLWEFYGVSYDDASEFYTYIADSCTLLGDLYHNTILNVINILIIQHYLYGTDWENCYGKHVPALPKWKA